MISFSFCFSLFLQGSERSLAQNIISNYNLKLLQFIWVQFYSSEFCMEYCFNGCSFQNMSEDVHAFVLHSLVQTCQTTSSFFTASFVLFFFKGLKPLVSVGINQLLYFSITALCTLVSYLKVAIEQIQFASVSSVPRIIGKQ